MRNGLLIVVSGIFALGVLFLFYFVGLGVGTDIGRKLGERAVLEKFYPCRDSPGKEITIDKDSHWSCTFGEWTKKEVR